MSARWCGSLLVDRLCTPKETKKSSRDPIIEWKVVKGTSSFFALYHQIIDEGGHLQAHQTSISRSLAIKTTGPASPVDHNDIDIFIE